MRIRRAGMGRLGGCEESTQYDSAQRDRYREIRDSRFRRQWVAEADEQTDELEKEPGGKARRIVAKQTPGGQREKSYPNSPNSPEATATLPIRLPAWPAQLRRRHIPAKFGLGDHLADAC